MNNLFESCGISKTILNYWDNVGYPEGDDAAIIIANSILPLSQKIERLNSMSSGLSSKLQNIIRNMTERYENMKTKFFDNTGYFLISEVDDDGYSETMCIVENLTVLKDDYFKNTYLRIELYPYSDFTSGCIGHLEIKDDIVFYIGYDGDIIDFEDEFNIYVNVKVPFKPLDIIKVSLHGKELYGLIEKYATTTTDLDYSDTSVCYCEVLNEYFEFNHKHLNVLKLDLLDENTTDKRIEILEAARDIIKNKSGFEYLEYLIYEAKKESNIT